MLRFTDEHTWSGGYYELSVEVGPRSDMRLEMALKALWEDGSLEGCWLERETEPSEQTRVSPSLETIGKGSWLHGIATLPNGQRVCCGTCTLIDLEGVDWLDLCKPMGSLGTAYDVGGFPFGQGNSESWRQQLDGWLVELGRRVFARVPYQLALIGFEIGADIASTELMQRGLPSERGIGYLWARSAESQLRWYPPTIYEHWTEPQVLET